jgi:hypothetical protein
LKKTGERKAVVEDKKRNRAECRGRNIERAGARDYRGARGGEISEGGFPLTVANEEPGARTPLFLFGSLTQGIFFVLTT